MLKDKTIMITGAASGIGKAAASLFAERGASIVLADRDRQAGERFSTELVSRGYRSLYCEVDIASEDDVRAAVDKAVEHFGKLDGAFNNAGIGTVNRSVIELTNDEFTSVVDVNLRGTFFCMKWQARAMRQSGGGAIVNNASVMGVMGRANAAEYVSSKHGVVGLTRAASVEFPETNVRVNAVLPGVTITPMLDEFINSNSLEPLLIGHSMGRFGQPEDVAKAAGWLLSADASFINGVCLPVDGGYSAR